MDSEKGREVKAHYLSVARRMRSYSASLHKQWYETVESQLLTLLHRTLLVVPRRPTNVAAATDFAVLGQFSLHRGSNLFVVRVYVDWQSQTVYCFFRK